MRPTTSKYLKLILSSLFVLCTLCSCNSTSTNYRNQHQFFTKYINSQQSSPAIQEHFKKILQGLNYTKMKVISEDFFNQDQKRIVSKPFPRYQMPSKPEPKTVPINAIHFMQNSIWGVFTQSKYDVITTAHQLKDHSLLISQLPKLEIWQDQQHRIWTLDHRRLAAMTMARNVKNVPVIWASKQEVQQYRSRYTTTSQGKQILMYLTHRLVLVIDKHGTQHNEDKMATAA